MGFAQFTHTNVNSSQGSNFISFFGLKIRAEEKSPEITYNFDGTTVHGYYEIVWFLNSVLDSPVFKYHSTNKQMGEILCAETFPEFQGQCPACAEHQRLYALAGGKDMTKQQWQDLPLKKQQQKLIIPTYIPRRAQQKHIYKGTTEVLPIYWFHLQNNSYPPEAMASYLRLRAKDDKFPVSQNPYLVMCTKEQGSNKNHYYFDPVGYDANTMGVFIDHPLLKAPYLNPQNPAQKGWSREYHNLMELLPILSFSRYVGPDGQPFQYGGYWDQAMAAYEYVKGAWPPPSRKLDNVSVPQALPFVPAAQMQQQQVGQWGQH